MRRRLIGVVACAGAMLFAGCASDPASTGPLPLQDQNGIDLVPDYATSSAAAIDGAGVGAAMLPAELALTADQKAQIQALHEAFTRAHTAQVEALRRIERQIHDLRQSGGTPDQVRALLAQAKPILDAMAADFARLQDAIWAVYTPAQRAWIEAHRPKVCGPNGPPPLSEAQVAQMRALREAFQAAVAADLATIKAAHDAAEAARRAGKSRTEVEAILAAAMPAMERVRRAERKLQEDMMAVLTPEQRANMCIVRNQVAPPHP